MQDSRHQAAELRSATKLQQLRANSRAVGRVGRIAWERGGMEQIVSAKDRAALLREGIALVEASVKDNRKVLEVTGAPDDRVRAFVLERFGPTTRVTVVDDLPRRLYARPCVGYMEREPPRLQLRYLLWPDEHIGDIEVVEDDESVVVLGMICASAACETGDAYEAPVHIYLERPLGGRTVYDGCSGDPVPYRNVYDALNERIDREGWPLSGGGAPAASLEERFAELLGKAGDEPVESRSDGGG
jgi:hypothetical protein